MFDMFFSDVPFADLPNDWCGTGPFPLPLPQPTPDPFPVVATADHLDVIAEEAAADNTREHVLLGRPGFVLAEDTLDFPGAGPAARGECMNNMRQLGLA